MWVAKNSLTGYEYPKKFDSIYDCDDYIKKNLIIVEYLCQRIKVLEDSLVDSQNFDIWLHDKYGDDVPVTILIYARIEYALKDFMADLNSSKVPQVAEMEYHSNHVIRCYNLDQKRFATGFDY